jgi:Anaphase-promoting complex APC subunit CDC26
LLLSSQHLPFAIYLLYQLLLIFVASKHLFNQSTCNLATPHISQSFLLVTSSPAFTNRCVQLNIHSSNTMLRRPPTSIHLTADDLAIFEKQYAQGQIYSDHQPNSNYTGQQQQQDMGTPDSLRREGQMAGNQDAGGGGGGGAGGTRMGGEERRVKSRDERIHGPGGAADNAGGSGEAAQHGR